MYIVEGGYTPLHLAGGGADDMDERRFGLELRERIIAFIAPSITSF